MQLIDKMLDSGDSFVDSSSSNGNLKAYSVLRADGSLAIMLLNTDPDNADSANVTLDIDGSLFEATGTQWLYGEDQATPLESLVGGLGNNFTISVPNHSLILLLIPAAEEPILIGDYNGDGKVSAADYTVWRDSNGAETLLNRDPDNVGPVGDDDFESWKENYGNTMDGSGAGLASSVPEPTSYGLLCVAWAAALARRRICARVAKNEG